MKKLFLIGNQKMNMSYSALEPYLAELSEIADKTENVVGVCVPYVYINLSKYMLEETRVLLGAQNMHWEESGAYTGEISANMLNDFGCDLVLVGHSERRKYFSETDEMINLKLKSALNSGITPILCFGETGEEREQGLTYTVIEEQLTSALDGIDEEEMGRIIFAYEPVWAIGTGKNATPIQAEEICAFAKKFLKENYMLTDCIMLYGGSLKPSNAQEIFSQKSINGGLIGGACLNIHDFEKLIETKVE